MDEIRKAIAEFMGWPVSEGPVGRLVRSDADLVGPPPNYEHDLNAMREVEARLHDTDGSTGWHPYILALMDLVDGGGGAEFGEIDAIYRVAHASAAERAQAAYQVIKAKGGSNL